MTHFLFSKGDSFIREKRLLRFADVQQNKELKSDEKPTAKEIALQKKVDDLEKKVGELEVQKEAALKKSAKIVQKQSFPQRR